MTSDVTIESDAPSTTTSPTQTKKLFGGTQAISGTNKCISCASEILVAQILFKFIYNAFSH